MFGIIIFECPFNYNLYYINYKTKTLLHILRNILTVVVTVIKQTNRIIIIIIIINDYNSQKLDKSVKILQRLSDTDIII